MLTGRQFLGRFNYKADLLESINEFCKNENIQLGIFNIIGALTQVALGYYDQDAKRYVECVKLKKKLEIASCVGNISLKDSGIFVHAHITLADHKGKCYGGHLMPGSTIFAAEYYIKELTGEKFIRKHDPETGLSLW
ncbi:MAG: PPC domain-containing DNA-binding protein [bacterium]